MKFTSELFVIATVILIAWVTGLIFKAATWVLNGLVSVAAIIVIIGLITLYIKSKNKKKIDENNTDGE